MARRGLVRSRSEAHHLITGGRVTVAGVVRPKPSSPVDAGAEITISPGPRYVGRAGEKLEAALDHFPIKVEGRRALDAGASTGGFTHCLLARGAVSVLAVDVGSGQIDSELARHPAVIVRERTDIRHLVADEVGGPFPLVVVDLSFISICAVTETLSSLLAEDGDLLILVKPQFEAGRGDIGRGVVRDTESQHMAVTKAKHCLTAVGLDSVGTFASPMTGEHGNQEYFLWARKRG